MHAHRGKAMWAHSTKVAVCKPREEALGQTSSADILILDVQPPEQWEINFCCKPLSIEFCYGSLSRCMCTPWSLRARQGEAFDLGGGGLEFKSGFVTKLVMFPEKSGFVRHHFLHVQTVRVDWHRLRGSFHHTFYDCPTSLPHRCPAQPSALQPLTAAQLTQWPHELQAQSCLELEIQGGKNSAFSSDRN